MGQWNRRYRSGGRRNYNYQEPPPSPPRTQPLPYGRSENGVPAWEIDFCYLSGVIWNKISAAKKFMHCHDSVMKWNDFGGEESFHNAKRRYWEEMNGLPCEDSSPDPEMYIGEVNWDSYIDPELMLDLDREYFNPDDEVKNEKLDTNSKEVKSSNPWEQYCTDDKNTNKDENTWESNPVRRTEEPKSSISPWEQYSSEKKSINKGENPWESNSVQGSEKLKSSFDPWERYCEEVDQSINKNAWRDSAEKSPLWDRGPSQNIHSSPHIRGTQHQPMRGRGYAGYNSWSRNQKGNDFPVNAASSDRPWGGRGNNSERRKFSGYANDDPRRLGFREQNRGGREQYDGCRKREGSMQHASSSKNIRFQANGYGTSYQWQN